VVAVMLNWSAVGHATAVELKLHSTFLLTIRALVTCVAVLVMVHIRSWPEVMGPEQSPVVAASKSTSSEAGVVSDISYVTGNGGLIFRGVPLSEPLKV
jgi:hypothetical protein